MSIEYQECAECAAKPGSPTLCAACLHNRTVIDRLKASVKSLEKVETVLMGDAEAWAKYHNRGISNECPRIEVVKPENGVIPRLEDLEKHVKNLWTDVERAKEQRYQKRSSREEGPPVGGRLDFRRYIYNRYGSWPPPKVSQFVAGVFGNLMYAGPLPYEPLWAFTSRWRWHDRIMSRLRHLQYQHETVVCPACNDGFYDAGSLGSKVPCEKCDGEGRVPEEGNL